jgi:drug/metabolite transporter (DMT)-like permease
MAVIVGGWEEGLGNAAFGLLVIAVLVNASVITSYFLDAKYQTASQVVWLLAAVGCLALVLVVSAKDHPDALKDADTVLLYVMFALSFPLGLVAAVLTPALYTLADVWHGLIYLVLLWVALVVAGYLQWFKLMPYLIGKLRALRKKKTGSVKTNPA